MVLYLAHTNKSMIMVKLDLEVDFGQLIKDASSETSLKSVRSSQRRLLVAFETVILGFQT